MLFYFSLSGVLLLVSSCFVILERDAVDDDLVSVVVMRCSIWSKVLAASLRIQIINLIRYLLLIIEANHSLKITH